MRTKSLAILALFLLVAAAAFGQAISNITGTVTDQSGAVVPNVKVEITNVNTKVVYSGGASATGNFVIPVPAGTYSLSVAQKGFKKVSQTGLEVVSNSTLRADVKLEVGTEATVVEVAATTSPLLKTEDGGITHNVSIEQADNLPVLTIGNGAGFGAIRNPLQVVSLLPGTQFSADNVLRVNGLPSNSETVRVEGQDATNGLWRQLNSQTQQGVEAIQEVAVQTSNYSAEFGQSAGGYFNYTMKSGTNQYHGSGYDYYVNEFMNAGTPYTNIGAGATGDSKKCYAAEFSGVTAANPSGYSCTNGEHSRTHQRRNDYGFTFGGPIKIPKIYDGHDKTFFFFNFEQFRETQGTGNATNTVPTLAYRGLDANGNPLGYVDMNSSIPTCTAAVVSCVGGQTYVTQAGVLAVDQLGRNIPASAVYDPTIILAPDGSATRNPFPLNRIPYTRLDPVAVQIVGLLPKPNATNANLLTGNYNVPFFTNFHHTTNPSIKLDHSVSSTVKISGYYSLQKVYSPNTNGIDPIIQGLPVTDNKSHTIRLNYDQTITPTLLLHIGVGYLYLFTPGIAPTLDVSSLGKNPGLPGVIPSVKGLPGFYTNQMPAITGISGATGGNAITLGAGLFSTGNNADQWDQKPTANANLTWVKNNHNFKAGGELTIEGVIPHLDIRGNGNIGFNATETRNPWEFSQTGLASNSGFAYASFLLGQGDTLTVAPPAAMKIGNHAVAAYVQDSWKVTRKLTIDYGVRYDFQTLLKESYGRMQSADWNTFNSTVNLPGTVKYEGFGGGRCNCSFSHNYPWGIGPRLSFAYQISPKTVIRGGAAVTYGTSSNNSQLSLSIEDFYTFNPNGVGIPAIPSLSVGNPYGAGNPYGNKPLVFPDFNISKYPSRTICPGTLNGTCYAPQAPFISIDDDARPPRILQMNFGVQHEIMRNLVIDASYVGNRGVWFTAPGLDITNYNALNIVDPARYGINMNSNASITTDPHSALLLTTPLGVVAGTNVTINPTIAAQGLATLPYAGFPITSNLVTKLVSRPQWGGTVPPFLGPPLGISWYDSLQVKVTKRYSHGLDMQGSVTYGKELGVAAGSDTAYLTGGAFRVNDVYNTMSNKSLSPFDQPLRMVISGTYTTPKMRGDGMAKKVLSQALRDWQIGAVLQYQSGSLIAIPTSLNALFGQLNRGGGLFSGASTGWNLVGSDKGLLTVDPNCHCFDPNTQTVLPQNVSVNGVSTNPVWVDAKQGQFGVLSPYFDGYRWMRQPSENMNFGRNFRIGKEGKQNLQIRAEFQNVFNRHFYSAPTSTNPNAPLANLSPVAPGSPTIGAISSGFGTISQAVFFGSNGSRPRTGLLVARFTF